MDIRTRPTSPAPGPVLLLCCLGQLMVALDVTVVNVALPTIAHGLGFSAADLSWVVNAYTICFAGFLLLGGRIADVVAPRTVLVGGLALFCGASLLGGLAPDAVTLVLARGVQGLGAAVLAPATLSTLTTVFSAGRERSRALATWGAVGAGGGAAGMLVGGLLTQLVDWRAILLVNLPLGAVVAVLALRHAPPRRPQGRRARLDVPGAVTVSVGLVAVVDGLVRASSAGRSSPATVATLAVGVALLAVFVGIEARVASDPLVPLGVLRHRALAVADLAVLALGFVMISMWYFVTLYLQDVLGYDPIDAGLAFLPMTVLMALCSRLAGPLVHRTGARPVLAAGLALLAAGILLFARAPVDGRFLADVLAPMLLCAGGVGLAFVAGTAAATEHSPASQAGLASGLVTTARQVGGGLGLAVLAGVAAARTDDLGAGAVHAAPAVALTGGFHLAFALGGAVALLTAVAVVALLPATPAPARAGEVSAAPPAPPSAPSPPPPPRRSS